MFVVYARSITEIYDRTYYDSEFQSASLLFSNIRTEIISFDVLLKM